MPINFNGSRAQTKATNLSKHIKKESSKYTKHFNRETISCIEVTQAINDLNMQDVNPLKNII